VADTQNLWNITVGADPEFFVRRKQHWISGHTFPVGTKKEPKPMLMGAVQADGIALEINVKPSKTKAEFIANVRGAFGELDRLVKGVDKDAELVAAPSIFFGHQKLSKLPEEAADLGCEPDFNAYEGEINPRPNKQSPIRTGAGHIHVGWTTTANPKSRQHIEECASLVKELDYYLGLPSLIWDTDTRRRTLYGQAGSFRPKPYGVEYRVLSNKWTETAKHVGWVFNQTLKAYNQWAAAKSLDSKWDGYAMTAINSGISDWHKVSPALAEIILK
jgi:hypothetical protein